VTALPPFEQVVEAHGPAVLRFCVSQIGRERAEDVFQETMLAALRAYTDVRDAAAVRSWLFSIAARKAIDDHRSRARAPEPVAELEQSIAVEDRLPGDGALWRAVGTLPPKQREAVGLRYVAELSHAEIARVMGTSEEAARRNVFEGLARLRSHAAVTDGVQRT
jgi:RNA polymerase sigma factor (sigma-70 family)